MATHSVGEHTPLLHDSEANTLDATVAPTSTHQRHDYLDNLRAFLTAILIFYHVAKTIAGYGGNDVLRLVAKWEWVALSVTTETIAAFLWGSFFFVSGYSSYLSITAASPSPYESFWRRKFWKRIIPAWVWYQMIHNRLVVRRSAKPSLAHLAGISIIEGPFYYVQLLIVFDLFYTFFRWLKQRLTAPSNRIQILSPPSIILTSIIFLFLYTLLFSAVAIIPQDPWDFFVSYDTVGSYAPLQFIIAYAFGVYFDTLKPHILIRPKIATLLFPFSVLLAFASLTIAQHLSPRLWVFIQLSRPDSVARYPTFGGAFDGLNVFYALWSTFIAVTAPVSVISLFAHSSASACAKQYWGTVSRHTYAQTFIHSMVHTSFLAGYNPMILAHSAVFSTVFYTFLTVFITWCSVRAIWLTVADMRSIIASIRGGRSNASEPDHGLTNE